MATRTIATRLALTGEEDYRAKLKNINAELALHKSELEKVQVKYKDSANSMEALTAKQSALKGQLESLDQRYKAQADMLEKARKAQQDFASKAEELRNRLDALKDSSSDTADEQKKLQEELDRAEVGMQKAANSVVFYQKQLNGTERDQAKLGAELEKTERYMKEAANSTDQCAQSIDKYGKEVKDAKTGIQQLAEALAAAGVAKTAKEIADVLMECAGAAASFETSMAKLSTLVDTSVYPLENIQAELMKLSNETGMAVGALSEAAYQALSAGVDTANVVNFVATATKTSTAGFTDSATAVDVLTTAINAYKLEGSEAEKVASMLVKTQDEGKTSVGELAQNMGRVIPIAASYKVSLENLTTAYAILTKNGTNTAISTTNLSTMFTELGKKGSTVSDILLEQTGRSFAQLMEDGKTLGDVMAILSESVDGDATAFSNLWSSSTAGQSALSLLNSGAEEFNRTLGVMENSSGSVERNFKTMAGTTEFAQQRMTNAIDNLKIAVGAQLNPALEKLYDLGANAFTWATDFVEDNPWVVGAIVGITAALGTLAVGMTAASVGATAVKAALDILNAHPLIWIATAAAGAAGAVIAWATATNGATEDTQEFNDTLKETKVTYESLMSDMRREHASTKLLADSLHELLAVEEKSALQKDMIQEKIDRLNEAVPELGLAYDREKDALEGLTEAELDSALARAASQEAYALQVERLNELDNTRVDLEAQLTTARQRLNEAEAANLGTAAQYRLEVENLTWALNANALQVAEVEYEAQLYSETQRGTVIPALEETIAEVTKLQAAYEESYSAAMESIEGQLGLFNKLDGTAKTTIGSLIDTLKGQVEYMETYADNIQKAMEMGVDEGLVKKLSDGSEKSAQILAAIVKGGKDDIAALNEQLAKVEEGKNKFSTTVAEMETDFDEKMAAMVRALEQHIQEMDLQDMAYTVGKNNIQGLIDGTVSKRGELAATYTRLAREAIEAYKREVDQHSPSKKFEQAGRNDMQGVIKGAEGERQRLETTYAESAQAALDAMALHLPTVTKEAPSPSEGLERRLEAISAATVNAISGIGNSGSSVPVAFTLVFPDGTKFASYYFDPMTQYADANGTPILNPIS